MSGEIGRIRIREPILKAIVEHARSASPLECCGLLTGGRSFIDGIIPCTNELRSSDAFSIPAAELFAAFRELRDSGRQLLGIYHSHPSTSAWPSARDFDEFHYPDVSCWIVTLQEDAPVVRCFSWTEKGFVESEFEIVEEGADRTR